MKFLISVILYKINTTLKINLHSLHFTRKAGLQIFQDINIKKETYKNYRLFYFLFFGDYSYKRFVKRTLRDVHYINSFKTRKPKEYDYDKWKVLEDSIRTKGYAPKGGKEYILVSKDLCIIEGHHRAEVLKNLQYEDIIVNCTNYNFSTLVFLKHIQYLPILFFMNILNSFTNK